MMMPASSFRTLGALSRFPLPKGFVTAPKIHPANGKIVQQRSFNSVFRGPLSAPRIAPTKHASKTSSTTTTATTRSFQSQHSTQYGSSTSFKVALGVSGVVLVCGLDCIAPNNNPFKKDRTYWNDKSPVADAKDRSPLQSSSDHHYKCVIVGGGMAGLHTALALAERSRANGDILVLDANRIGQSASGQSKGLVVPGIQVPQEGLEGICGSREIAKQVYELTYQAARRLKEDIVQRYKIDCGWVDAGLVEASLYEDDEHDEEEEDDGCHVLSASQVRQVLGQPNTNKLYKCGEYDPSCSGVDPFALTSGLARVVETKWGVRICEQTKVTQIDAIPAESTSRVGNSNDNSESPKYVVTTDAGAQVTCQHVVLCTGPELVSKQLSRRLANAVTPIYTWMASTAPLGDQCPLQDGVSDELLADQQDDRETKTTPAPLCGDDFVSLNYWRRTNDGRILFGSLADAYPIPQWLAEYRLRLALKQIYPQLANVKFDHVWGGKLAFSRDAVPLIGRDEGYDNKYIPGKPSDGGVWYATGFGGHGIVPTVMAGSVLADAMLGIDDDTWRLFQREFPPKYSFYPVSRLGAQALLTTYNVFDWLTMKGVPVPRLPKPW
ncbi:Catalyzes the last two steps in the biosynthesis of 5- methylaminomethyl-2-thiouridine (mnm(5)s(2)U) at the wobble position (U34) in tRNA. Catalyzes the FAD-dependent demodification of cmnm(5)s(2)U34 to nm(5)s(2)U34 [Seminavis robusta]|uniref:FAD dependent oxidoreductase domain-containing protein n=1 Tax=Seminavis robusta TaxID=568900 RepID=A0A9N8EC91_9STRA|nr:Catalyzes the last two steps in the biosynthesis of 5- methylaminomethyl-2-thiouridine (mnm(5)s(2)U) at the wobble position (U34) in tRNA. Catalyzes the FAD-dependent demodification of cmnm(5)s(2)U34 to nm(5)s(2)U34 [Seminavis robusta]|eukprot:Sro878_g214790.1 Catalyzes the last two steps in the biosynthesis of 5- methylaminomethyl-2-thiouridine (mnm(5)s(2)U) at the wobble position (U34) in tRNA. Catalyzes the FAD-dependent demodification of cmnm(5)s(2)U34 to nm(5)s(2)U34 (608) ;mRNA; f:34174-36092